MWHMQGYFDFFGDGISLGSNVVYHYNQGFKGLSGSNSYLYQGGNRYVMAILSHGFDPPSMPSSLTGHVRLNSFLGNFMYYYAPEIGLEEEVTNTINIYPNPCNEKIYIDGLQSETAPYTLVDIAGKLICSGHTSGFIETNTMPAGIYYLSLDSKITKMVVYH